MSSVIGRSLVLTLGATILAGCANESRQPGDGLPFYDSPDFTPHWGETVDHTIGDFSLFTQTGDQITDEDLHGHVHVASFIFTRCDEICPTLVARLSLVQDTLTEQDDVLLVSYSVTPEYDTVDVLAEFGEQHNIDPDRWKLVTGESATLMRLARESYFADDPRLDEAPQDLFLHTEKVLLVDTLGRLRGVYNGTLPFEIAKLVDDLKILTQDS